eukprot:g5065.t1
MGNKAKPDWFFFSLQTTSAICEFDFEVDVYNADWSCGRHSRRDHKFRHVTDDWHGFLLTFDVKLYADVWLKTGPSKGQSAMGKWTHWGHVFWPRPFNSTVGNGIGDRGEDLEMSAVVKRAKLHAHEVELRYWWHGEMVTMREPELLAETVEAEDAFQNKRLYTAMLAAKARKGGGGGGEERKAKRKEEL